MGNVQFVLSDHAVTRFKERFCPGFEYWRARRELAALLQGARRLKEKSVHGQDLYEVGDTDKIQLVVKRSPIGLIVVTCLPAGETEDVTLSEVDDV